MPLLIRQLPFLRPTILRTCRALQLPRAAPGNPPAPDRHPSPISSYSTRRTSPVKGRNSPQKMASVSHPDQVNKTSHPFERQAIETLLLRRFFFCPAFEIYGGVKGLYDYGPPGAALQANILDLWRKHFIIEEEMLEVDTTIMTLSDVLKTSGHVDRFTDWMVRDLKTNEVYRADHLVEGVLQARIKADAEARGHALKPVVEDPTQKKKKKVVQAVTQILPDGKAEEYETVLAQIDNLGGKELGELIRKEGILAPDTGNEVSEPVEFNLMFETQIGPTGQIHGYLRPETAQGHFVNFNRLLEFNNGRVPFASAQIGRSFRNEISPKQGLLRVREFTMAEIEHYVDPQDKAHDRFDSVKHVEMQFLPKGVQESGKTDLTTTTIGQAVEDGMVDNMTLGYFIARIYLFLTKIGIDPKRLRFRQHMANEMAHYAADCWDAEILNSYGWIECVGCADRSAYDLTVHANRTQQKMVVRKALEEVHVYDKLVINLEKKSFGPMFKKDAKALEEGLLKLTQEQTSEAQKALTEKGEYLFQGPNGQEFKIPSSVMSIKSVTVREQVREFVPNVIEPSFGIGRILYSLLEHSYWARAEDVNRGVLSLPPSVAPVKVLIVPLSNNAELKPLSKQVSNQLRSLGIASRVDDSGASIGKRYARNDELGTPYGVTIDFASVKNGTITLRERDTTFQVIGKVEEVVALLVELCSGRLEWAEAATRLPAYTGEQEV
ncbi:BZ3500_MvSof-1268-A1-R1_Chr4-4g07514 [Microbotryum saponariae]|uniref:glycine--tRNA ligase n=1 Tax=Microbotryum saponariae TaxID=289078 RepID=A0A2X0MD75_9BASI|nr:BZ3500_MvSof-1268-A1-R1_Chr4-4g07514 [Microbotryum saponariae]SDA07175.1 BZ3501_MvSof-1269-A2-R1_Chr4-3g07222 [Microbotryum saponariae]